MKIEPLKISAAWTAELQKHRDNRGTFQEWVKFDEVYSATGYEFKTSQANFSKSSKNVVRGIHYSLAEKGQMKWITCLSGAIRDVVVDIRVGSPTFGQWEMVDLSPENPKSILIGAGLGHAFVALEEDTYVSYLLTSEYSRNQEFEINPFDEMLAIDWGIKEEDLILSEKDINSPSFHEQLRLNNLPIYHL